MNLLLLVPDLLNLSGNFVLFYGLFGVYLSIFSFYRFIHIEHVNLFERPKVDRYGKEIKHFICYHMLQ